MNKIKHVGNDWNYLHDNYQYARINFFNDDMKVKTTTLKDIKFNPIFEGEVTIDKIRSFYKDCIKENWNMNMKDFEENYKNLVNFVLFHDYLLIIKFEKEKYYKLFNIEKGQPDSGPETLFAPYSLELSLEYITFSGKVVNDTIEFIFRNYVKDFLIVRTVISDLLTIVTEPFCVPDYIIAFNSEEEKKSKLK